MKKKFYASETKEAMQMFTTTLNERDFRRYAAVEALKLEHGGIEYISRLLNDEVRSKTAWLRLNLNEAPLKLDLAYEWTAKAIVQELKNSYPKTVISG